MAVCYIKYKRYLCVVSDGKYTAIPLQHTEIINSQVTSKMLKKDVSTVVGYHSKVELIKTTHLF